MAWIESHQSLERHPKTLMLATAMGWDIDVTIGKLHRFWWWCVDYAEDGDLRRHNDECLGAAVGLNGENATAFVRAMRRAGWLDEEPYFRIHDWWDYIGRFLCAKYRRHPAKWQSVRAAYAHSVHDSVRDTVHDNVHDSVRTPIPNLTKPNQTKHTPRARDSPPADDELVDSARRLLVCSGLELSVAQNTPAWFALLHLVRDHGEEAAQQALAKAARKYVGQRAISYARGICERRADDDEHSRQQAQSEIDEIVDRIYAEAEENDHESG